MKVNHSAVITDLSVEFLRQVVKSDKDKQLKDVVPSGIPTIVSLISPDKNMWPNPKYWGNFKT